MERSVVTLALIVGISVVPGQAAEAVVGAGGRVCVPTPGGEGSLAVVNLTPVNVTTAGHGVLIPFAPSANEPPTASNVNFRPGSTDPNVAAAEAGADGLVCFVNSPHGKVDLAADLLFTMPAGSFTVPDGGPVRLADTRVGLSGPRLAPSERRCLNARGAPGDLAAVNLTPVGASAAGHGALVASDLAEATTSNVNFAPGTTDPNLALATIGTDGRVCFVNSRHAGVDLVADQLFTVLRGGFAEPVATSRLLDTRTAPAGPLAPGERRCFAASGAPGELAIVNLTPVGATAPGHGALVPPHAATGPVGASNVNFAPGTVDPNLAAAEIGSDGTVCFANSNHASVHVVADQLAALRAWDPTDSPAPVRLFDSRIATPLAGQTCPTPDRCYSVAGRWFVYSTDGGRTWVHAERVAYSSQEHIPGVLAIRCTSATTCVYSEWAYRTQLWNMVTFDGGKTWRATGAGPTDGACPTDTACLVTLAFVNPGNFGRDLSVEVTLDGGDTWTRHDVPDDAIADDVPYEGLECAAPTRCTLRNITFESSDGWATVSVTVAP